jgi:The GLUG motif
MTTTWRASSAKILIALLGLCTASASLFAKPRGADATVLIHNTSELQSIQENLSGNYKLANDINASGFTFNPIGDEAHAFSGTLNGNGYEISSLTITSGAPYVGLFAAVGSNATITNIRLRKMNIQVDGTAGQRTFAGGIAGANGGTLRGIIVQGILSASGNPDGIAIGGLAGTNDGSISFSQANTSVSTTAGVTNVEIGGLVGGNSSVGSSITYSNSNGPVGSGSVGNGAYLRAGGLVGTNVGTISNSYSYGSVTAGSGLGDAGCNTSVGGLSGVDGWTYSTKLVNSFASGPVSGGKRQQVGGLVGCQIAGSITNAYATGSAKAGDGSDVGGLIGNFSNEGGGSVNHSYATGVTAAGLGSSVGGLVGKTGGSITHSYWDVDSTGITDSTEGCGNVSNCSGVVGLHTKDFRGRLPSGLNTPDWMQINFPFRQDYPKLWSPSFPITAFPLKGYTPYSIPIISVFDHSLQDSPNSGIGRLYACDQVVRAFDGGTGRLQYGADASGCQQPGYKQQSGAKFVLNGVNYVGLPAKYLEYDGHPGFDLHASYGTPVYAAVSGTVFYPWKAVGSAGNNDTYCRFHTLAQIPDTAPTYRLYYLHLSTHPARKGQTNPDCSSSKDTDGQTVDFTAQQNCYTDLQGNPVNPTTLPLPEGTHTNAGCEIALSGDAGVPGAPHLHFEIQQMVPAAGLPGDPGRVSYFACYDENGYKQGTAGVNPYCLPADPYGYTADDTQCNGDASTWTGDIWQCLTGIPSRRFWPQ